MTNYAQKLHALYVSTEDFGFGLPDEYREHLAREIRSAKIKHYENEVREIMASMFHDIDNDVLPRINNIRIRHYRDEEIIETVVNQINEEIQASGVAIAKLQAIPCRPEGWEIGIRLYPIL